MRRRLTVLSGLLVLALAGAALTAGPSALLGMPARGAAAAGEGQTISAVGVGVAAGVEGASFLGGQLRQSVKTVEELPAAVKALQDKAAALRTALLQAGIAPANIQISGPSVLLGGPVPYPLMGVLDDGDAPTAPGVAPTPSPVQPPTGAPPSPGAPIVPDAPVRFGYQVMLQIQIGTTSIEQTVTVIQIAAKQGVSPLNSFIKGPGPGGPPDASVLEPAINRATNQAAANAQAAAKAAGLALGSLKSVEVGAPMPSYLGGPMGPLWQVQVTLTYNVGA